MMKKTLEELASSDKIFFTAEEISGVVGSDAQAIRVMARQRPELLGFDVVIIGNRVKIPRIPFLRSMGVSI